MNPLDYSYELLLLVAVIYYGYGFWDKYFRTKPDTTLDERYLFNAYTQLLMAKQYRNKK